jgi:Fe-S-cluster containining protein
MIAEREKLIHRMRRIQASVRSCAGCGLCCTRAHNSVRIMAVEARHIARYVAGRSPARRAAFRARLRKAIQDHGLRADGVSRRYTCPFLEADLRCALPLHIKPTACLAFNPLDRDRCDMDADLLASAYRSLEKLSMRRQAPTDRHAIPIAVLAALGEEAGERPAPRDPARVRMR